jgi:hypothetical protein
MMSYAERKNRWSPNNPTTTTQTSAPQRQALTKAINEFVTEAGAWIVSPIGSKTMRVECPMGSTLPQQFRDLGYTVSDRGVTTRIIPSGQFATVNVIEIDLPR